MKSYKTVSLLQTGNVIALQIRQNH